MTEEVLESKQEVEETTDQTAPTDETNTEDTEPKLSEESKTQEEVSEVDYKAELARVQKSLGKAEKKIVELKRQDDEVGEVSEDTIVEKLWSKFDERLSQRELQTREKEVNETISNLSSNEDEANLIKWHLENSVKPTGDILTDVSRAKLLANEKKMLAERKEIALALKTKSTQGGPNFSSSKETNEGKIFTSAEKKFLQRYGVDLKKLT